VKPGYGDDSSKHGLDGITADSPQAKPDDEDDMPNYDIYKPKQEENCEEKEKPYVVKSKREEKHYHGSKPDNYKQAKPDEKCVMEEEGKKGCLQTKHKKTKINQSEGKPFYGTKQGNDFTPLRSLPCK